MKKKVKVIRIISMLVLSLFILDLIPSKVHATEGRDTETKEWSEYGILSVSDKDMVLNVGDLEISSDVHSNGNIKSNSTKLSVNGVLEASKKVDIVASEENINIRENTNKIETDDVYEDILNETKDNRKEINGLNFLNGASIDVNNNYNSTGNTIVNASQVNFQKSLLSDGEISLNSSIVNSGEYKSFIASRNSNITVNAANFNFKGIIYAPNGVVNIQGSDINIEGRIIANEIIINGSKAKIKQNDDDFDFIKDEVKPDLSILSPSYENDYLVTQDVDIDITGIAKDNKKVEKVEYQIVSEESNNKISGQATGIENWAVEDIPLELGMNYLKVIAYDTSNNSVEKVINIKRMNTEINFSDDVVYATENDAAKLKDQFINQKLDQNKTDGYTADDRIILKLTKNNILLDAINKGNFGVNKILYFDPCDVLPSGFSGKLESYNEVSDGIEFRFKKAEFNEMINDYVSFDLDNNIDFQNDIAYILAPDGTRVDKPIQKSKLRASEEVKKGVQLNELVRFLVPKFDGSSLKFGDAKDGLVIYDEDGLRETKGDQVVLKAEQKYSNFQIDSAFDWNMKISDVLPKQIRFKFSYDDTKTNGVTFNKYSKDLEEVVDDIQSLTNSSFENKIEFLNFFDIEGVKLDDTIVLGCVGVRTNAGTSISLIPKYTLDGLAESSSGRLDPIISLMIVMDMSGEISLKASIESNTSSYVEKGFNIQKEGYVGKGGSVEDNKGQKTYDLAFDRVADVYDRECNSRYELDKEPVTTLKGSLEGKASVDFGLGVGIGCFTMGIMPGMVRASGYAKFDSNLKGDFLISSENSDIGFEGKFGAELGIRVRVDGRVATDLGVLEFKYVKPWVLWSKGIGTSDDLKIVLTWSDLPRDLDSHLYTSKGNHIYYSNKYEYGYDDSNEYKKFIDLDIDDTSGWGPETTTIYEYTPGVYTFKVNDYTNRWDSNSYELSQSRAVVKVYKGDQELQTFVVPTEKKGTVWNVFSYDTRTDTITSINTIN